MSERSALVVGGGGREHQLGLSIAGSVNTVYFAPGNAGTAAIENGVNLPIGPSNLDEIAAYVKNHTIDLTVVGPEQPLVDGLADQLREQGSLVFGPSAEAARLEGSKADAVEFMRRHRIPHPLSDIIITRDEQLALMRHLQHNDRGAQEIVIKADGLASGKGVVIPANWHEAVDALHGMFSGKMFGEAGKKVVIQERLSGPELSIVVICDGKGNYFKLPTSQDHKRLLNNDKGANTGGMGAYAPVPHSIVDYRQQAKVDEIIERTIAGASTDGTPYEGALYIGLMLADQYGGDPIVMEFNVRFGDPETQAVLPLLQQQGINTYDLLRSAAEGRLDPELYKSARKLGKAALTVCLAADGYPESPRKGDIIHGLEQDYLNVIVQHGGTKKDGSRIVTAGGRVLYVTGLGETIDEAAAYAYAAIGKKGIHFEGMQYRTDIGHQARSQN
jgi:phosphoribosylamine--glycine ligase